MSCPTQLDRGSIMIRPLHRGKKTGLVGGFWFYRPSKFPVELGMVIDVIFAAVIVVISMDGMR